MESATSSLTFKGSIPEAIIESQRKKKLFLVYVSGKNDQNSAQMEQSTWADTKVDDCISRNCVFLHLMEGSVDASNFSMIYPQKSVPCITAVSYNGGKLLWQLEGYITAEKLVAAIEETSASLHLQETAATVLTAALATNKPEHSSSSSVSAPILEQGSSGLSSSAADEAPPSSVAGPSLVPAEITAEESMNLTGKPSICLVNASEIDCDGEQPSTSCNENEETLVLATLHAENFKNQCGVIASEDGSSTELQDKAVLIDQNYSLMDSSNHVQSKQIVQGIQQKPLDEIEESIQGKKCNESDGHANVEKSNDIHLHIRLPDGSSLQRKFCITDTLSTVKNYVDENQRTYVGPYDLATPYPKRIYSFQDMSKSLSELGLVKRDSLIVVPHDSVVRSHGAHSASTEKSNFTGAAVSATNGGMFEYVKRILSYANPFSYFGGGVARSNMETTSNNSFWEYRPNPAVQSSLSGTRTTFPPNASSSGENVGEDRISTSIRPGSNIHTLRHDRDDSSFSDRNSFWNGNSTQYGGDNSK